MIIHPEIFTTPDFPTIKFREPREQIDLSIEIPKILNTQGWGLGTYFNVQFISHDRTGLIASGLFIVTGENESLHTSNPESYQPVTKSVAKRTAEQIGDWFVVGKKEPVQTGVKTNLRWNPGKKVFQVMQGDDVVFESANKEEAVKFKEAA